MCKSVSVESVCWKREEKGDGRGGEEGSYIDVNQPLNAFVGSRSSFARRKAPMEDCGREQRK